MKVLDLFSGIGGFSLGLERAGFETVAFCEIDEHCRKVLRKHWPDVLIFDDISKIAHTHIYAGEHYLHQHTEEGQLGELVHCKDIDIICGGYPCVGHSVAGKKEGFKNEQSGLWFQYKRVIQEVRPKYVIIENSPNLRNTGLARLLKDCDEIGYNGEWEIVSARSVGAEHLRERIYLVLWRKELTYPDAFRLWRATTKTEAEPFWWAKGPACFRNVFEQARRFKSAVVRVVHGVRGELDPSRKTRIQQLGNSVVPQIPYLIGKALMEHENVEDML